MPSPLASCALSSNFSGTSTVIFRAVLMTCTLPYLIPVSSMVSCLRAEEPGGAITISLRMSMFHGAVQRGRKTRPSGGQSAFQIRSSCAQFLRLWRFERLAISITCLFSIPLNIPTPPASTISERWCPERAFVRAEGHHFFRESFPDHIELPKLFPVNMEEGHQSEFARFADGSLQVSQLMKKRMRLIVRLSIESCLPHHQNALGTHGKFKVNSQVTKKIQDYLAAELLSERLQVLANLRLRQFAGVH